MDVTMSGKHILITGDRYKFEHLFEPEGCDGLYRLIKRAGGSVEYKVTRELDYVVLVGHDRTKKYEKAVALGLKVIDIDALRQWLSEGTLHEDDPEPTAGLGELIAEARGILDGPASSEGWEQLIRLCERCESEMNETLLNYLEDQVDHWAMSGQERGVMETRDVAVEDKGAHWHDLYEGMPGVVAVAPSSWVAQMLAVHEQPEHRLTRAIVLPSGASPTMAKRLLKCTWLDKLRVMNFGQNDLSKDFFRLFAKWEGARGIEELHFSSISSDTGDAFDQQAHTLGELGALTLWCRHKRIYGSFLRRLGEAEAMARIERITLPHGFCSVLGEMGLEESESCFPALECVEIGDIWTARQKLEGSLPERVTTLRLSPSIRRYASQSRKPTKVAFCIARLLDSSLFERVSILDLTPMSTTRPWPDDLVVRIVKALEKTHASTLQRLEALRVGVELPTRTAVASRDVL